MSDAADKAKEMEVDAEKAVKDAAEKMKDDSDG
jgi:hypothetical protein